VICYFRLIVNPGDEEALRRIINYPARGIGETTFAKIASAAQLHGVSLWQVLSDPLQYNLNINSGTAKNWPISVRSSASLSNRTKRSMPMSWLIWWFKNREYTERLTTTKRRKA